MIADLRRRTARRIGIAVLLVLTALAVAVVVTSRPGDRSLWPAPADAPTIGVWVVNHGYHMGIVVPRTSTVATARRHGLAALAAMAGRFAPFDWLEIGWGDEQFYRSVPTAASFSLGLGLRALFWPNNNSVLHVVGLHKGPGMEFRDVDLVPIAVSEAGFARLLARIDESIVRGAEGTPKDLGPGLYGTSRFFAATGRFHLFNVCNHWIADLLAAAGLPTAPIPSVLPYGLLLDLKWRAGLVPIVQPRVSMS